ncbi:Iron-regulated protein A [Andreprevotia sp. IGB-42]|uniref:imelysin family protein n=1 Tax=Andreprevotia sp. IGB-42 TaxID=2497473 RepID=UPI00135984EB|nr:imelysin family protein [Andreprevotia sp. IGB-42]KAF0814756.1 Iron-regulated protein A [Andreprevotia sp. IGB-42]
MHRSRKIVRPLIAAVFGALLVMQPAHADVTQNAVLEQYANVVSASYGDALAGAKELQVAINAFVAAPSADGLANARKAWLAARESYGQTEAFRFYGGPIDDDKGPEGRINAWPLDEAYIDAIKGKPKAGIINNPKVAINAKQLSKLNERGGEENIATGWHAIEFLLWGQDFSETGPGDRPYTDYTTAPNADRRKLYLQTVAQLLVDDLDSVAKQWTAGDKNFRSRFVAGGDNSIKKILTGIGTLSRGELAGERIEVALDTQNQEDEHSCFSDNTHRDIVTNAKGIQNVWEGRYVARDGKVVEGASLKQLVAQKDAKVADAVSADVAESVKLAEAIQAPFDREIVGKKDAAGRKRVQAVVESLKKQAKSLVEAAKALGIKRLNTSV